MRLHICDRDMANPKCPNAIANTKGQTSLSVKNKMAALHESGKRRGFGECPHLSISCSFSSSSRCRWMTDSMIDLSSSVRCAKSGIGGRDGRRATDIVCRKSQQR